MASLMVTIEYLLGLFTGIPEGELEGLKTI